MAVISAILSSSSLICPSASVILLLISSSLFFISVIVWFLTYCLFFSSSRSFLIFLIHASILFPRSWIIFTVITLNSFSGRLPVFLFPLHSYGLVGFYVPPSSASYFSVISFCLTYCFYVLLSTGCRVIVPLASVVCPLVSEVGPGACAGFLVGRPGACAMVGRVSLFPLKGRSSSVGVS